MEFGPTIVVNNYSGILEMQEAYGVYKSDSNLYGFVQNAKLNPSDENLENDYFNLINSMTELDIYSGIDWSKVPAEWASGFIHFKHNDNIVKSIAIFSHLNFKI